MEARESFRDLRIRVHDPFERTSGVMIHGCAQVPSVDVDDDVVRVPVAIDRIAGGVRFPGVQYRNRADRNLMLPAAIGIATREVEAETDLHVSVRV